MPESGACAGVLPELLRAVAAEGGQRRIQAVGVEKPGGVEVTAAQPVSLCGECWLREAYLLGRCYDCNEFKERMDEYQRDAGLDEAETIEFEEEL
jgi:hypothetical protein